MEILLGRTMKTERLHFNKQMFKIPSIQKGKFLKQKKNLVTFLFHLNIKLLFAKYRSMLILQILQHSFVQFKIKSFCIILKANRPHTLL